MILATDIEGCIGYNNDLPYKFKEDLKNFKKLTTNGVVIMGRKTFESMGSRPLPNRINFILSKSMDVGFLVENTYVFNTIEDLFDVIDSSYSEKNVWIIGGSEIYKQFLPICDEIYHTKINAIAEKCDTYFNLDLSDHKCIHERDLIDEPTQIDFKIIVYKKIDTV